MPPKQTINPIDIGNGVNPIDIETLDPRPLQSTFPPSAGTLPLSSHQAGRAPLVPSMNSNTYISRPPASTRPVVSSLSSSRTAVSDSQKRSARRASRAAKYEEHDPSQWGLPRDPNALLAAFNMTRETLHAWMCLEHYKSVYRIEQLQVMMDLIYRAVDELHGDRLLKRFQSHVSLEPEENAGLLLEGLVHQKKLRASFAARPAAQVAASSASLRRAPSRKPSARKPDEDVLNEEVEKRARLAVTSQLSAESSAVPDTGMPSMLPPTMSSSEPNMTAFDGFPVMPFDGIDYTLSQAPQEALQAHVQPSSPAYVPYDPISVAPAWLRQNVAGQYIPPAPSGTCTDAQLQTYEPSLHTWPYDAPSFLPSPYQAQVARDIAGQYVSGATEPVRCEVSTLPTTAEIDRILEEELYGAIGTGAYKQTAGTAGDSAAQDFVVDAGADLAEDSGNGEQAARQAAETTSRHTQGAKRGREDDADWDDRPFPRRRKSKRAL